MNKFKTELNVLVGDKLLLDTKNINIPHGVSSVAIGLNIVNLINQKLNICMVDDDTGVYDVVMIPDDDTINIVYKNILYRLARDKIVSNDVDLVIASGYVISASIDITFDAVNRFNLLISFYQRPKETAESEQETPTEDEPEQDENTTENEE